MAGAFSQFHQDWTVRTFDMDPPPPGSQDIRQSNDGHDGANGKDGKRGGEINGPGPGHDGGNGSASHNIFNNGSALVFHQANPLGQWSQYSNTGYGGDGGNGGDAGTFVPTHDSGPWPDGGDGGKGGASGNATSELDGHTIWGHRGTNPGDGVFLGIGAYSADGGNGGDGGNGDGEAGPVNEPGGDGGDGGRGGNSGDATVTLTDNIFKTTGNTGDIQLYISGVAAARVGGDGGLGGLGGLGGSTGDGADGFGGLGGNGGDATILIQNLTFDLSGAANSRSTLYLDFLAYAGDGGDGASSAADPLVNSAAGGLAGNSSIEMRDITITGGAEDDYVGIDLETFAGFDGRAGDGTFNFHHGLFEITMKNVAVEGGGGHNTLAFAVSVNQSGFGTTVDLVKGMFRVDGVKAGTVSHIDDVIGAGRDDYLIGNATKNMLTGGSGEDRLHGGGGIDTFVYNEHGHSFTTSHDWIDDIDFGVDKISLYFSVLRTDKNIDNTTIHANTFDADLTAAATSDHFRKDSAVLVSGTYDDNGTLSQRTFLLIDENGIAGYQIYDDMVIDVTGWHGKLKVDSFIDHSI